MKRTAALGTVLGLVALIGLVVWQGVGEVGRTLAWAGPALAWLVPIHLVVVAVDAAGWRVLFEAPRPAASRLFLLRWVGESVNQLLPVAQIGGEVVKARLLAGAGTSLPVAAATVVVALTTAALAQAAFGLVGVGLLLGRIGRHHLLPALLAGLAVFAGFLFLFYRVQRKGLFTLAAGGLRRLGAGGRRWGDLASGAAEGDAVLRGLWRKRRRVGASFLWHLGGWFLGTAEVWVALRLLGAPVSWGDALLLESLGQAVRGAAFVIPGALGVQEGAFLALGALVGLNPATALALSLAKRSRELLLGLPGLAWWQIREGAGAWRRLQRSGDGVLER